MTDESDKLSDDISKMMKDVHSLKPRGKTSDEQQPEFPSEYCKGCGNYGDSCECDEGCENCGVKGHEPCGDCDECPAECKCEQQRDYEELTKRFTRFVKERLTSQIFRGEYCSDFMNNRKKREHIDAVFESLKDDIDNFVDGLEIPEL